MFIEQCNKITDEGTLPLIKSLLKQDDLENFMFNAR